MLLTTMMYLSLFWLAVGPLLPVVLAVPTPEPIAAGSEMFLEDTHLTARGQDPNSQCKFSLFSGQCAAALLAAGVLRFSLGSNSSDPNARHDPLGQQVGGASPCFPVKTQKIAMNNFWLTDNTCAHADKIRYDVSVAHLSIDDVSLADSRR
jgi:hypothetical protein